MARGRRRRKGLPRRKSAPTTRTIFKTRYRTASPPPRRRRVRGRRSSAKTVAAAVGSVAAGAAIGALANEAGLLQYAPTQNKTGISAIGWVGLGLTGFGLLFAKREATKLLTYGLGGGLITTEVVRQIDMRGYDFSVAFGNAPPLLFDPTPPRGLIEQQMSKEDEALRGAMQPRKKNNV